MLKGIFAATTQEDDDQSGSKSPRSIAIGQLQCEREYLQNWSQMNNAFGNNALRIADLKTKFDNATSTLDQEKSEELWKSTFSPQIQEIEKAQTALEENRKKLDLARLKVLLLLNL